MARFIFRLATLLKARIAEERRRQVVVAQLERERMSLEDQIRAIQRAITVEKLAWRDHLAASKDAPARLDIRDLRYQATASLRLAAKAQHLVLQLAGAHTRLTTAREQLLEATTARKAVDLLRERQYEEFLEQQKRAEFAALDEIMVMKAGRTDAHASMEDAA